MGNNLNINSKIRGLIMKTKTANSQIGQVSHCPNCDLEFPSNTTYETFDMHVEACLLTPQQPKKVNALQTFEVYIKETSKKQNMKKNNQEKVWTKYLIHFDEYMLNLEPKEVFYRNTAEKIIWFHHRLSQRKIDWKIGAQQLIFSPNSIVVDSLLILKFNLFKEIKITVNDDIVKDAGGLLREWSVLLLKQLIGEFGLFEMNKQGYYRLRKSEGEELNELYELLGAVLAKIILQKITIPFHFDHTFLSLLCGCFPELKNFQTFDRQLYDSWEQILEAENIEDLQLTFSILVDKKIEKLEQKGEKKKVTNQNKRIFIDKCMNYHCSQRTKKQMYFIKKKFNQYISTQDLQIFSPEEFEMIINGVDSENINVQDWKKGTQYRQPYKEDHKVIKWFWNIVGLMNAKEKSKLLKFVTGSEDLPIFGFKSLETNRGKTSCFVIEGCKYDKKKSFPRAHTCFNRLILPVYPSQEALAQALFPVIRCEFEGVWGLQ